MARRYSIPRLELLLVILLAAGCASNHQTGAPRASSSKTRARNADAAAERESADRAVAHARYASALIHEMNGETEAALEDYNEAALRDPGNETLVLDVARRLSQGKELDKAVALLEKSAARKDASGAIYARLGSVYSQQGKREQAISAARTAVNRSPDLLGGYQTLFIVYMQAQQSADGWKVLEEAFRRNLAPAEYHAALSELYLNYAVQVTANRQQANEKALALLDRAEKGSAGNAGLRLKIADGFNLLGETRRAAAIYLELLKSAPDTPVLRDHIRAKLADLYIRSNDPKLAAEQLQELVKAYPTNPQAYYFLGSIAYDQKQYARACEYFSKTVLLSPEFEQAQYDLALSQLASNQAGAAVTTLLKARERFPQSFTLELLLGMAYSRQKDGVKALEHFTTAEVVAKATDPKRLTHSFYLQLAAAYEAKGDLDQAERQARRALEMSPDSPEVLNFLGYMWADRNVRLAEAREMIEKAVKAEPENAAFLDSLGWVLFRQGETRRALEYIEKAIRLNGEPDATLYEHQGDVLHALGEKEKAREAWKKSVELEPAEKVRQKLESLK